MTPNGANTVQLPPTSPPRRRRTGIIVLIVGAVLVLAVGGAIAFGLHTAGSLRHDTSTESVAGVHDLVVTVDEGFVSLRTGTGTDVEVRTTRSWTNDEPVLERQLSDGVLTLGSDCPAFNVGCEVEREIVVPAGTTVTAKSVDGAIKAVDLDTPRFTATTVDGSVTASFAKAPQQLQVQAVDGDVRVTVPPGAYHVTTKSVSGGERVDVTQDPAAPREISVRTVSGDIEILHG